MLKRKFNSIWGPTETESRMQHAPGLPVTQLDNNVRHELKRYKNSPTTYERIIAPLRLKKQPNQPRQTIQSYVLESRQTSSPLDIGGPLAKLPDEAYPLLDVLTVHILCRLQFVLPQLPQSSTMQLIASSGTAASLAYASGTAISQFIEILLEIANITFSDNVGQLVDGGVLVAATGLGLSFHEGILRYRKASDPNFKKYNNCAELWKKMCKTENLLKTNASSTEQLATDYYTFVFRNYGVSVQDYVNGFFSLMQQYSLVNLVDRQSQLETVYASHPQSAHGLVIYYIFCHEASAKSVSEQRKVIRFFAHLIRGLAQLKTNESFRNAIVSIYATVLTQVEGNSIFNSLVSLLNYVYIEAERLKDEENDPFMLFYLGLVWNDVETTVKHRLDLFCEKYPNICFSKRPDPPLAAEEMV